MGVLSTGAPFGDPRINSPTPPKENHVLGSVSILCIVIIIVFFECCKRFVYICIWWPLFCVRVIEFSSRVSTNKCASLVFSGFAFVSLFLCLVCVGVRLRSYGFVSLCVFMSYGWLNIHSQQFMSEQWCLHPVHIHMVVFGVVPHVGIGDCARPYTFVIVASFELSLFWFLYLFNLTTFT